MTLHEILMELKLTGPYGQSLMPLITLAQISPPTLSKRDVVYALEQYYDKEENLIEIWNTILPYERDLLYVIIEWEKIDLSDVQYIFSKYGMEVPSNARYLIELFPEESKAKLFFIGSDIPRAIRLVLRRQIKPFEPDYHPIASLPLDRLEHVIEIGESFEADVIHLLQLINKEKLKVTKVNQRPAKGSMIKMNAALAMKEWKSAEGEPIEDIRNIEKTHRLYSLFQLLMASSLIEIENDTLVLGSQAEEFLAYNRVEKCELLYESYMDAETIYDLDRLIEVNLKWDKSNFTGCRKVLVKHLTKCPVNEWLAIDDLVMSIKRLDRKFLQQNLKMVYINYGFQDYYTPCAEWTAINERYIEVALLDYLAQIGMVDVCLSLQRNGRKKCFKVDFFRLTPLGGHILGIYDDYRYEELPQESGFLVQPNFEVLISDGSLKDVHSLFFDGFADKTSGHPISIYKITFPSMIKALDNEIQVQTIIDYLQRYSERPIPQNVLATLESWEKESRRIRIRSVTILEADDPYLIEELKTYKSMEKHMKQDLKHVVEIEKREAKKIKREIEKKGRFCLFT